VVELTTQKDLVAALRAVLIVRFWEPTNGPGTAAMGRDRTSSSGGISDRPLSDVSTENQTFNLLPVSDDLVAGSLTAVVASDASEKRGPEVKHVKLRD
jgi:hypothetical protein